MSVISRVVVPKCCPHGKINRKRCTLTESTGDGDVAAMAAHNARDVANPRPVPFPCGLVVKNGSKIRSRFFAEMPLPVSETVNQHVRSW